MTDFTQGSIVKALLLYAVPLFCANVLQVVYNMVDMIVVGKSLGEVGLSAVSVGGDIINMMTFLVMGFCSAGEVIIAQLVGADQKNKIGRMVGTMVTTVLIGAFFMMTIGIIFQGTFLRWMNVPDAAFEEAKSYAVTCMFGLPFVFTYNSLSSTLRGIGDSKHPFMFIAISSIINIILDITFVLGFSMGAFGAALATALSQFCSCVMSSVFIYKKRAQLGFELTRKDFGIHKDTFIPLFKLGVPFALRSASINITKLFVNSWINSYGLTVSAVSAVGHKINTICNTLTHSVTTAAGAMIGQNIGAEKHKRVLKIVGISCILTFSLATICSGIMLAFPRGIFNIFCDPESLDAMLPIAMEFVPVAIVLFYASAARGSLNALISGSGNSKINLFVAILDGIVLRIGLSLLFGFALHGEYVGIWYGDAVAGFGPAIVGIIFLISGKWKRKSTLINI